MHPRTRMATPTIRCRLGWRVSSTRVFSVAGGAASALARSEPESAENGESSGDEQERPEFDDFDDARHVNVQGEKIPQVGRNHVDDPKAVKVEMVVAKLAPLKHNSEENHRHGGHHSGGSRNRGLGNELGSRIGHCHLLADEFCSKHAWRLTGVE